MKKLLTTALLVMAMITLAACNGNSSNASANPSPPSTTPAPETTAPAVSETPSENTVESGKTETGAETETGSSILIAYFEFSITAHYTLLS